MVTVVVLAVLGAWLLIAVMTTVACVAVVRGGAREDRLRGFLVRRPPAGAERPGAHHAEIPASRQSPEAPSPDGPGST
jgi:hypothetical protein